MEEDRLYSPMMNAPCHQSCEVHTNKIFFSWKNVATQNDIWLLKCCSEHAIWLFQIGMRPSGRIPYFPFLMKLFHPNVKHGLRREGVTCPPTTRHCYLYYLLLAMVPQPFLVPTKSFKKMGGAKWDFCPIGHQKSYWLCRFFFQSCFSKKLPPQHMDHCIHFERCPVKPSFCLKY